MLRAFARLLRRVCFSRRTLKIACLLLLVAGATIFIADRAMVNASKQLTWSDVNAVPARNVGLLLGARPGNRYFTRRIDTAAELYHAGKVKWLLVSGDNGRKNYDEASGMQQALIAKGVPAKVIFCDYAGFSTLDSVVRAKKVFGENHITIISQEFHNQRAIGFNAPDLNMKHGLYTQLREKLARVSAVIDAKILHRQPKYLGPSVMIGPFSQHGCPAQK
ncbi:vancomycin high temperature exclusion protein [Escherichia fergusonii]|uniref:SanA/YdcF family protein n=1 Tax=Escherichia fergusonii TaxID=564 RepID=UPI0025B6CBE8|nr:vancomycin high temperature exclusion protein [Escherichia fergusonii]MDN4051287.1 vancomycin high temperature exclusion protein [Escherichia fergusonii]